MTPPARLRPLGQRGLGPAGPAGGGDGAVKLRVSMNLPTLPMTREEFWRQYWDRIDRAGTVAAELPEPNPNEGCWIWTGSTNAAGGSGWDRSMARWPARITPTWIARLESN